MVVEELGPGEPLRVGRYRITGRLGGGGMGRVYMGHSPSGRLVAVKVVRPELAEDADFRRRFAREVDAARKVTGFFTAAVVDADPDGSPPWLATAYVPGMPLDETVQQHGAWPADATLTLGSGLAEALEAIHQAGLVHRDLKPSNVLIAPDGPRVVDFGISVAAEATALTRTGMVVGTAGFMAPEQLLGKPVTPATDVFALGAVLAYVASGTGPFGVGSAQALNFRIAYEEPELGALPAPVRAVVAQCLAKEPGERPSVAALVEGLAPGGTYEPGGAAADGGGPVTAPWIPEAVSRALTVTATAPTATPPPPTEVDPRANDQPNAPLPNIPPPTATPAPTSPTAPTSADGQPATRRRRDLTVTLWLAIAALTAAAFLPTSSADAWGLDLYAAFGVVASATALRTTRHGHRPGPVPRWPKGLLTVAAVLTVIPVVALFSRGVDVLDRFSPGAGGLGNCLLACACMAYVSVRFPARARAGGRAEGAPNGAA